MKLKDQQQFGEKLKRKFIKNGWATEADFEGCSQEEIDALCKRQGVDYLPPLYISFLRTMGKRASLSARYSLFIDSNVFYPDVLTKKEELFEAAQENGLESPSLPSDAFVFESNIYGHFYYFETAERDENPLLHCVFCESPIDGRPVTWRLKDVLDYDTTSCATMLSNLIIFLCLVVLLILWFGGFLPY
jgi:hypothetical protein